MYGTDYPLIMHQEGLIQIDAMDLKHEARVALLHDTAVKVFKLDDPLIDEPEPTVSGSLRRVLITATPMTGAERAALVACCLSREITDADVVGVGLGTPLALAAALAARTGHAPGAHVLVAGALSPDADVTTCMGGAAALRRAHRRVRAPSADDGDGRAAGR